MQLADQFEAPMSQKTGQIKNNHPKTMETLA